VDVADRPDSPQRSARGAGTRTMKTDLEDLSAECRRRLIMGRRGEPSVSQKPRFLDDWLAKLTPERCAMRHPSHAFQPHVEGSIARQAEGSL
jgi:hypothetical protein